MIIYHVSQFYIPLHFTESSGSFIMTFWEWQTTKPCHSSLDWKRPVIASGTPKPTKPWSEQHNAGNVFPFHLRLWLQATINRRDTADTAVSFLFLFFCGSLSFCYTYCKRSCVHDGRACSCAFQSFYSKDIRSRSEYRACEKRSDRDALAERRNRMIYLHLYRPISHQLFSPLHSVYFQVGCCADQLIDS